MSESIDTSLINSATTDISSLTSSSSSSSSSVSSSSELTEDDLEEYLNELKMAGNGNSEIARKIKNAMTTGNYDSLQASTIEQEIKELEEQAKEEESSEPQDPSTVTQEQITPPVDISV